MKHSMILEKVLKNQELEKEARNSLDISIYECSGCNIEVFDLELYKLDFSEPWKKEIVKIGCQCEQIRLMELEQKKLIDNEKEYKKQRIEKLFQQSKLGRRFMKCTFENFNTFTEVETAYTIAFDYMKNFENYINEGKGIFFQGGCGVGKTHLSASILHELIKQGYACIFSVVPELLNKIRNTYSDGEHTEKEYIDILTKADLLVLDDLGSERLSDWVKEKLFLIIDNRYRHLKPTIYTTNCSKRELEKKLGQRTISRIVESSIPVLIKADDYRWKL